MFFNYAHVLIQGWQIFNLLTYNHKQIMVTVSIRWVNFIAESAGNVESVHNGLAYLFWKQW